jgi:hypothetical protein
MFLEGTERDTNKFPDFYELRITGPDGEETSKDYWRLYVDINVLIQSDLRKNAYTVERMIGIMAAAFAEVIPVYQYGDDAAIFVGCLKIETDSASFRDKLRIRHYGVVDEKLKLQEASVSARFKIELTAPPERQFVGQGLSIAQVAAFVVE